MMQYFNLLSIPIISWMFFKNLCNIATYMFMTDFFESYMLYPLLKELFQWKTIENIHVVRLGQTHKYLMLYVLYVVIYPLLCMDNVYVHISKRNV